VATARSIARELAPRELAAPLAAPPEEVVPSTRSDAVDVTSAEGAPASRWRAAARRDARRCAHFPWATGHIACIRPTRGGNPKWLYIS
jgi:hypothetical protein